MATSPKKPAAPPARGKKAAAPEPASFEDLMDTAVENYPEPERPPEGAVRVRVRSATIKEADKKILLAMNVIEYRDGSDHGDLNRYEPVFANFDMTQANQVGMLKKLIADGGVDTSLTTREIFEKKVLVGVEYDGEIVHRPSKDDPNRIFVNVNRLGPAS